MMDSMQYTDTKTIEEKVKSALLREVYVTPKPGLVDLHDCGAHTDMDVHSFEKSTEAVTPFLLHMFETGFSFSETVSGDSFSELFLQVREIGKEAEQAMFTATKNVNTHKGMIFSMGLMLTAMGVMAAGHSAASVLSSPPYEERVCCLAGKIAGPILRRELQNSGSPLSAETDAAILTHGERVFVAYGADGVRGEAIAGFPCLREVALPRYRSTQMAKLNENDRALDALLAVMSTLSDTNLLARGGPDALAFVQSRSADILASYAPGSLSWRREIERFNTECIDRHISPGGAADMLALLLLLTSCAES